MKKLIIWVLMLILSISLVYSATNVYLDQQGILANQSYRTNQTVQYTFNVTGNESTYVCKLYNNENGSNGIGSWSEKQTESSAVNNTITSFSLSNNVAEVSGLYYVWDVFCNTTDDGTGAWGGSGSWNSGPTISNITHHGRSTFNFTVDINAPSVTINYPSSNGAWYDNGADVRLGLTVIDNNPAQCVLDTNLNVTDQANTTGFYVYSLETYTYTNNTQFNFTKLNTSSDWDDNNTGAYLWTYTCNDSAGNTKVLGTNYTFFVDTVKPSDFVFNTTLWTTTNGINIKNGTDSTDYTPTVGWNQTYDLNFSKYAIYFRVATINNLTGQANTNVSLVSTVTSAIASLSADLSYIILITAFDLAGNQKNMTLAGYYQYQTDSTSRALASGWNIIMNTGNAMTLSNITSFSGGTQGSYFNSSHQFQTFVDGGNWGTLSIPYGEAVFIYMASAGQMEDWVVNNSDGLFNITNQTDSDWNIACNRNTSTTYNFQELDEYLNTYGSGSMFNATSLNVTFMDFYNNSAPIGSKYIPYISNWSGDMSNTTPISYADCAWMEIGQDHPSTFLEINWLEI